MAEREDLPHAVSGAGGHPASGGMEPGPRGPGETGPEPGETSHWLPAAASVIALLRERGGGAWAAGVAIGLADIVGGRRGRTFLANTVPGVAELDGLMDAVEAPGLTKALSGDLPLSRIARSAPHQAFAFLPAGSPALPLSRLREIPAFHRLLRRVSERGGTVLLYLAEEDLADGRAPDPDLDLPLDGCIAIGEVEDPGLLVGAPLLARVERPAGVPRPQEETVTGPAGGPDDGPAETGGDVAMAGRGGERFAAGRWPRRVLAAAGLAAAASLVWLALPDRSQDAEGGPAAVGGSLTEASAPSSPGPEGADAPPGRAATADPDAAPAATDAPPAGPGTRELPYSVLIASFARPEDATRHLAGPGAGDRRLFVAPTPIRGRVYYRVMAGALPDRTEGESLMRDLVAEGRKERARAWDVRPVRLAWFLATYAAEDAAREHVRHMGEAGVPGGVAYVLAAGTDEAPAFAVYAGAFESEDAAGPLGEMLREAGETPRLVSRRGRPT